MEEQARRQPAHEGKSSGRAQVLWHGVVVATLCFFLHPVVLFLSQDVPVFIHIILQAGFAAGTSMMFPVLDGMTVDFLHATNKADYGKERLWGAVTWAVAHIILAPLLDHFGFSVMYLLGGVSTLGVWICLRHYAEGQRCVASHKRFQRRTSDVLTVDDPSHVCTCMWSHTRCTS